MTIIVEFENRNTDGKPAYVDVHHRNPKTGAVTPQVIRTYALEPGEMQKLRLVVHSAQVLVVREGLEIPHGEVEQ